ncbi:MAG: cupin domain-containing protein [Burkholderiaceae bacterium]|nr:MAG: cupin domain-containing protein [Burkholderiaceae bacterium]
MTDHSKPIAVIAEDVPPRAKRSLAPEPFASRLAGREKRPLGDVFALSNFGVNLTHIAPGAISALRHAHALQDEFIYVLQGNPVLVTNAGETQLQPGMCAGFKAGTGDGHHLLNRSDEEVVYLEVGDRTAGDTVTYPDDDLQAIMVNGQWQFNHWDGTPY